MLGDITLRRETLELRSRSEIALAARAEIARSEMCALLEKVFRKRDQQEQMPGDRR